MSGLPVFWLNFIGRKAIVDVGKLWLPTSISRAKEVGGKRYWSSMIPHLGRGGPAFDPQITPFASFCNYGGLQFPYVVIQIEFLT